MGGHEDALETPNNAPYRVFVSYSRDDREMVRRIVDILHENGLDVLWDEDFSFGQGFHHQIRNFIAHAHIFLPVLTKLADERKWVHQEIGYAMALNIPVLPVAIGSLPGEMIEQIHAVSVSPEAIDQLGSKLNLETVRSLVDRNASQNSALYTCADYPQTRATMIAQHCDDVLALKRFGLVRQKGGLTTFHLPTELIQHRKWKQRYDPPSGYTPEHCLAQRAERLAVTKHAEVAGCKLIIIPPSEVYLNVGTTARLSRLRCLQEFLMTMTDDNCQVATCPGADRNDNLLIVGNWFTAESVSMRREYRQTIFTRHAPTVAAKVTNFDTELNELLDEAGVKPGESRSRALDLLDVEIKKIPNNAATRVPTQSASLSG
jgi:TIR domain-containing protein